MNRIDYIQFRNRGDFSIDMAYEFHINNTPADIHISLSEFHELFLLLIGRPSSQKIISREYGRFKTNYPDSSININQWYEVMNIGIFKQEIQNLIPLIYNYLDSKFEVTSFVLSKSSKKVFI